MGVFGTHLANFNTVAEALDGTIIILMECCFLYRIKSE